MNYIDEAEKIFNIQIENKTEKWISHSRKVANAAKKIAEKVGMDGEKAYAYGLLHDIGRSVTDGQFQHIIKGYELMMTYGYEDIARICLTHSYVIQDIYSYVGKMDAEESVIENYQFILQDYQYNDYDLLIQLCDAISTDKEYIIPEQRFVNLVFKYGFNDFTIQKWKKTLEIKESFDKSAGCDVLALLK